MKGTIRRLSEILSKKQNDSRAETAQEPTIKGYKFVSEDLRSYAGDRPRWTPEVMRTYNGKVKPGSRGFHASSDLRSALDNKLGDRLFEVEAHGVVYGDGGMFAAKEMKLMREIYLKRLSVEYAIGCARHVLPKYENKYPDDDRPRKAIEAAEKWLKKPTKENMLSAKYAGSAARSAAESAGSTAWYAGSAAGSAAESAADSAGSTALTAWAAARSAGSAALSARSAGSAAWSKTEEKWQTGLLEELVKKHYKS